MLLFQERLIRMSNRFALKNESKAIQYTYIVQQFTESVHGIPSNFWEPEETARSHYAHSLSSSLSPVYNSDALPKSRWTEFLNNKICDLLPGSQTSIPTFFFFSLTSPCPSTDWNTWAQRPRIIFFLSIFIITRNHWVEWVKATHTKGKELQVKAERILSWNIWWWWYKSNIIKMSMMGWSTRRKGKKMGF